MTWASVNGSVLLLLWTAAACAWLLWATRPNRAPDDDRPPKEGPR